MKLSKRRKNSKRNINLKKRRTQQKYRYNKTSINIGGSSINGTPPILSPSSENNNNYNNNNNNNVVLSPMYPWRLDIIRAVLLGIHDPQSPLCQLRSNVNLCELIIRGFVWSEMLVNWARDWQSEMFLEVLLAEMIAVNPGTTEDQLRYLPNQNLRLVLNPDGSIKSWNLNRCGLRVLPELFGAVCTTGYLWLDHNQLNSLPDSFGSIVVGDDLGLDNNHLITLPDSFGSITVGSNLMLYTNQLHTLPESFGSITVGLSILLNNNQLSSLPDSFGSITVNRHLYLYENQLSSLPDSFGSITVKGDLYLSNNQLSLLPASFGSITVGGDLWLDSNQLSDQTIPTDFPNISGIIYTIAPVLYTDSNSDSNSDY